MKKKRNHKYNIDATLLEMMIGIGIWGLFWQLAGVWFVKEKVSCSFGLWIGVLLAVLAACHMYYALDKALSGEEKDAQKIVMGHSLVRYGVLIIIFGALATTNFANPLTAFLGVMGLKAAAYMQPFVHKFLK